MTMMMMMAREKEDGCVYLAAFADIRVSPGVALEEDVAGLFVVRKTPPGVAAGAVPQYLFLLKCSATTAITRERGKASIINKSHRNSSICNKNSK